MRLRLCAPETAAALCTLAIAYGSVPAAADPVADFYAGKLLRLYVSAVAGGGYDNIARAFVRHYSKHVPGKPNAQVMNMPGGGGIVMSNWAYNIAPKDGTVIAMPNLSMVMNQVIYPSTVKYDATKFHWIGNIEPQVMSIFTWHTSQTRTIEQAMARVTPMAASTHGSPLQQILSLSNLTLGTKFQIALGYNDTRVVAIERGEVDGSVSSLQNFQVLAPHWMENGARLLNILVINSDKRLPKYPNVPTMLELAKTAEHKAMLEFMMLQGLTGRAIFTPPDVPADRLAALRAAFDTTMKDAEFLADMKRLKVEVETNTGDEVAASVRRVVSTSPEIAAKILKAIE